MLSGKLQSFDEQQLSWLFDKMKKPRVEQIKQKLKNAKADNTESQIKELKERLGHIEAHVDMEEGLKVIEVPLNHTGSSAQSVG